MRGVCLQHVLLFLRSVEIADANVDEHFFFAYMPTVGPRMGSVQTDSTVLHLNIASSRR